MNLSSSFRFLPIALCLALFSIGSVSRADTLLYDDFEDIFNGTAAINSPDLIYSPLSGSDGFTFNTLNGNPGFADSHGGWNTSSIDTDDYLTFTLTAVNTVNWNQISLDIASSPNTDLGDTGPVEFSLRSTAENFGTDLLTSAVTTTFQTLTLHAPVTLASGDSIEYRLYFWGAQDSSDQSLVDNLTVSTVAAPEPNTGWLLMASLSGILLVTFARRVRR